jgi:biopolymer transport protein ExbB/TolQ
MGLTPISVNCFAAGGLVYAFQESTVEGKFVLVCLTTLSLFSWSVMITKFLQVRRARRETVMFHERFRSNRRPLHLYQKHERYPGSPSYVVYDTGCRELAYHLTGAEEADETFAARAALAGRVTPVAMTAVRSAMERAVGEQALLLEDQMVLLATAVSGAPFLGLLGTVWGVMDTFTGVAMAGKASLQAMAPGVSGALITTVFGLLVAIPAMFGYNFLVTTIRSMTVELDNFAAEVASNFDHEYLDTRNN